MGETGGNMPNLYLYFSGTGNTKYVVKKFANQYEDNHNYALKSIEDKELDFPSMITNANLIVIAYPIHEGWIPHIMKTFLIKHKSFFKNKNIITICTQMFFSGDGAAWPYYLLKDVNVNVLHAIHINMPNNISDFWFLPVKTATESTKKYKKADKKIIKVVTKITNGKRVKNGIRFYSRFLGYVIQRAYTKHHYNSLRSKVKIHHESCIACNKCVNVCPTENLYNENNRIFVKDRCTVCYRCVNECPTKSISIATKHRPSKQYIIKDYK
jgi:ferredoxin/flavodoxin